MTTRDTVPAPPPSRAIVDPAPIAQCSCGHRAPWSELHPVTRGGGIQELGDGLYAELRTCPMCTSTMAREVAL